MVAHVKNFDWLLVNHLEVPNAQKVLEGLPHLQVNLLDSVAIPTKNALDIYTIRYEVKKYVRHSLYIEDYEYLLAHLATYTGNYVEITLLSGPTGSYLLFIGESPVTLLGILHSEKKKE